MNAASGVLGAKQAPPAGAVARDILEGTRHGELDLAARRWRPIGALRTIEDHWGPDQDLLTARDGANDPDSWTESQRSLPTAVRVRGRGRANPRGGSRGSSGAADSSPTFAIDRRSLSAFRIAIGRLASGGPGYPRCRRGSPVLRQWHVLADADLSSLHELLELVVPLRRRVLVVPGGSPRTGRRLRRGGPGGLSDAPGHGRLVAPPGFAPQSGAADSERGRQPPPDAALLGMFLPLGGMGSVDAWLSRRNGIERSRVERVLSIASAAILLQMAFVYLFSAGVQVERDWLHGNAIAAILRYSFYGRPIGSGLLEYPSFLSVLTVGVLALEWAAPFFLFSPRWTGRVRLYTVLLLASMHVGIALLMEVGLFSFVSICGLILFLPSFFWDRVPGLSRRPSDAPSPAATREEILPGRRRARPCSRRAAFCALALFFVLFENVSGLRSHFVPSGRVSRNELARIGLGLGQKWGTFSRTARPGTGGTSRERSWPTGEKWTCSAGRPVSWDRPEDPTSVYPNHHPGEDLSRDDLHGRRLSGLSRARVRLSLPRLESRPRSRREDYRLRPRLLPGKRRIQCRVGAPRSGRKQ